MYPSEVLLWQAPVKKLSPVRNSDRFHLQGSLQGDVLLMKRSKYAILNMNHKTLGTLYVGSWVRALKCNSPFVLSPFEANSQQDHLKKLQEIPALRVVSPFNKTSQQANSV